MNLITLKMNHYMKMNNLKNMFYINLKKKKPYRIYKDNDVYVVSGDEIEKLLRMTKFTDEGARRFAKKLRRMGVDEDLQKMGISRRRYS